MAVVVTEVIKPSMGVDDRGLTSYTRKFQAIFDTLEEANPNAAVLAIPVAKYDAYSYGGVTDNYSRAMNLQAVPDPESFGEKYDITVNYSVPENIANAESGSGDGGLGRIEKAWSFNRYTLLLSVDEDNKPIANSAGDIYPEGLEVERFMPVLSITRNETNFEPLTAYQYIGSINLDEFYGAPKNHARCVDASGVLKYLPNGSTYWTVSYAFEFGFFPHGKGWNAVILDTGFNEKIEIIKSGGGKETIKRKITLGGEPVSDPQKLNGKGGLLTEGQDPIFAEYRVHRYASFGALAL